jgi:flavodoxin
MVTRYLKPREIMKAIIVYYSHSSNNEALAHELKHRLGCDILRIEEEKKRTGFTILLDLVFRRDAKIKKPDVFLSDYNTVVFISPIWDAQIATPLKTFIKMEREQIKNYAFITVCGGREGQKKKITDQLTQLISKKPIIVTELVVKDVQPGRHSEIENFTHPQIKETDLQNVKNEIQNFVNTVYKYSSELLNKPIAKEGAFVI